MAAAQGNVTNSATVQLLLRIARAVNLPVETLTANTFGRQLPAIEESAAETARSVLAQLSQSVRTSSG